MPKKKFKSAAFIGHGLAYIQHKFDKLFEWGFHEIKKKSDEKTKFKDENKFTRTLKKIGGYLGVTGEEYYKRYKDLKKKEK